jgi:hypothetical protein
MAGLRLEWDDVIAGALPPICMRCGAPAVVWKRRRFYWTPPWMLLFLLFPPLFIALLFVLQRRRKLMVPFCRQHRGHWAWRRVVSLSTFPLPFLLFACAPWSIFWGLEAPLDMIVFLACCFGALAGGILWFLLHGTLNYTAVNTAEISETGLYLRNVSPVFVRAYDAWRPLRSPAAASAPAGMGMGVRIGANAGRESDGVSPAVNVEKKERLQEQPPRTVGDSDSQEEG